MQDFKKLTERLMNDARLEADDIIDNAIKEAREIIENTKTQIAIILDSREKKAEKAAADLAARKASSVVMESKKLRLLSKQQLIDEALTKGLNKLYELPSDRLHKLYQNIILNQIDTGEYTLILNQMDESDFGLSLIKSVSEALLNKGIQATIILGKDPNFIDKGFVLKKGNIEQNNKLKAILNDQKEALSQEVSKILFSEMKAGERNVG